jgi:hypothetical protein
MDDRRPLGEPHIEIELAPDEFPEHFEGTIHYGPKVILEVAVILAGFSIRKNFGFVHNGAAEPERKLALSGWRTYLHYTSVTKK